MRGKIVKYWVSCFNMGETDVNLNGFSAGMYVIEVRDKEGMSVKGKLGKE